jgi:hypothetical protein
VQRLWPRPSMGEDSCRGQSSGRLTSPVAANGVVRTFGWTVAAWSLHGPMTVLTREQLSLAAPPPRSHALAMFVVTEADAAAIRAAFDRGGEFSAAVELRRLFPGITSTTQARECARTIAGWKPLPVSLRPVRLRRPSKGQ